MASIEQLERKVLELENQLREERLQTQTLLAKSNKALETALHAYKVDHFGFIWVYQYDTKEYVRTDMRVMSPELVDEAVKTRHLADGAVTGEKIAADAIDSSKIKDKTIVGRSIKADAIGTEQIKDQSITGDTMEPGAVPNGKLANNAVSERTIQDRSVTTGKLADLSVTTPKIEDLAVTEGKIADDSVSTRTIIDKNVTREKIADKAVYTPQIENGAVTHEKMHENSVGSEQIIDSNVGWQKLNDELQNIIASAGQHGVALSNEWGNSTLMGLTQKTLSEALGNVHKDGNNFVSLQQQIDEIVSGGATVNLVPNPNVIFANTATDITLTASANKNASSINITGGELSEPITGSGTHVSGTDHNVNLPVGTLTYLATFIISGLERTTSRTVSIVNKIYYGAGQSDAVLNTEAMVYHTPAVAQPSFTQVITTALNDYIYFEVPSEMNNITKLELYDDPSFPTELSLESVATTRAGYKAFKTVVPRLAGTHTYRIS